MVNLISRRAFLKQTPAAAVVASAPITVKAAESRAEPAEDSDMRCMRLARELFNAMKGHYGDGCQMIRNEDSGILIFMPPPPPPRIVEFAGPGWYELEIRGSGLPTEEVFVEIDRKVPVHPQDGRWFVAASKDPSQHKRYFQESWLRKIIVRKIGGVA